LSDEEAEECFFSRFVLRDLGSIVHDDLVDDRFECARVIGLAESEFLDPLFCGASLEDEFFYDEF
jgi:hypothetical protein